MPLIVCIIQARRQSERLPDKTLMKLSGRRVLEHVIARCQQIHRVDQVLVAAPNHAEEDVIENVALKAGANCYRGDMNDVLSRFYHAAEHTNADYIMRVTADCPLLDPAVCDSLVEKFLVNQADYGSTAHWPHGLDCEIFSRALLEKAHFTANAPADREHVTLWMKRQEEVNAVSYLPETGNLHVGNRWVLDYPEDYNFLTALFDLLPDNCENLGWRDILDIVDQTPELRTLNDQQAREWGRKNEKIYQSVGHSWKSPA